MNKKNAAVSSAKMVTSKVSCSTPEHQPESPSRDSDSYSESASPVPFLCTQDGAEGETDVVWNFYTPKSDNTASTRLKNSTPLSRKTKKPVKMRLERPLPITKRKTVKVTQKNTELFQDLIELNQNLHELIAKKGKSRTSSEKQSGSDDDIFSDSGESLGSPKSGLKTNTRCLRRNVLSSKFSKPDPEVALESDDSINECLIKASQIVEEKILELDPIPTKRYRLENHSNANKNMTTNNFNYKMCNDSMDAILKDIKLDSPITNRVKKIDSDSPRLNNDSFDSLVGNLNDSALERLTQMPVKSAPKENASKKKLCTSNADWTVQEVVLHSLSAQNIFCRHNSMPESPVSELNKPSTSGMVFGRYNSMPMKDTEKNIGDSPIRCTPEEIKIKHRQAREKLLAKRQLPFTSQASQQTQPPPVKQQLAPKKASFQPRVASSADIRQTVPNPVAPNLNSIVVEKPSEQKPSSSEDLKLLIERKRQEALLRLRRRQPQIKR